MGSLGADMVDVLVPQLDHLQNIGFGGRRTLLF